jgi:hypothetical protein
MAPELPEACPSAAALSAAELLLLCELEPEPVVVACAPAEGVAVGLAPAEAVVVVCAPAEDVVVVWAPAAAGAVAVAFALLGG